MTFDEMITLLPSVLPIFVLVFLVVVGVIIFRARRQIVLLRESILVKGELLERGEHPGGRYYLRCRLVNPYTQENETVDVPCSREEWETQQRPETLIRFMGRYQPTLGMDSQDVIRKAIHHQAILSVAIAAGILVTLLVLGGLFLSWM